MKYPHAQKGVTKLLVAMIIGVVATLAILVSAILAVCGLKNDAILAASGTVTLVGSIALLVAFIIQIVGLIQGGKDEIQIKYALFCTLAALVFQTTGVVLSLLNPNQYLNFAIRILGTLGDIAVALAFIYTLLGIATLLDDLGEKETADGGRSLAKIIVILFAFSIIMGVFPNFINEGTPDWAKVMVSVVSIAAALAELVVFIFTLTYYSKASKLLKK